MDESREGLLACAEDILKAVHGADAEALMLALGCFFEMVDVDEPEEGFTYGGDADDHLSRGMESLSDQKKQSRRFGER